MPFLATYKNFLPYFKSFIYGSTIIVLDHLISMYLVYRIEYCRSFKYLIFIWERGLQLSLEAKFYKKNESKVAYPWVAGFLFSFIKAIYKNSDNPKGKGSSSNRVSYKVKTLG